MKNINKYLQEVDEYIKNKNYNDAFSLCNSILSINSNNIEAIFKAGYCCYRLKKYDISMMHFIRASSLEKFNTNKAIYKYYIGRCYDSLGVYKEALEYFKNAYDLDNSNKYYTLWLGITYSKTAVNDNDYNNSLMYLSMSLGSEDYLVYGYIGYCHIQLRNYDKAIMHLEKSVLLKDNDYLTRYYLGNTYFLLQAYDKALEHLSESVKLKDDDFDNWFTLGLLYEVIGENILSDECFEKARNIALNNDDIEEELDCFIKLTDSQSDEYLNYLYLGICYAKLESYKNAIHYLLISIELNDSESNYLAYYWIGYINYIDSEYEDALKYFEKSISLNNYEYNHLILLWMGDCYFRLGNYKRALFNLKRSIDLKDDEAETYKIIAELYLKTEKKDKYHNYITKYKKLIKNNEDNSRRLSNANNYLYEMDNALNDDSNDSYENNISENKMDIKNIYNNALGIYNENIVDDEGYYNSKKIEITYFINLLFQDIENSDLYNLYSFNTEKKSYIDFNNFNIDNFLSYRKIINNSVKNNFDNTHFNKIIKNIVSDFDIQYGIIDIRDKKDTLKMINNIEEIFDYTSACILNSMYSCYQKHDIELYLILMELMVNNL
ncbi:CDC27 family protein [Brachyspira sp.]|uniref:tetratricopeptide repeat protein n=1 Tax=Brachyspira sp. TaxID=1977261 RepID=UPI00260C10A7|nr:CDC27 family protein [Brachyspira sp.]